MAKSSTTDRVGAPAPAATAAEHLEAKYAHRMKRMDGMPRWWPFPDTWAREYWKRHRMPAPPSSTK